GLQERVELALGEQDRALEVLDREALEHLAEARLGLLDLRAGRELAPRAGARALARSGDPLLERAPRLLQVAVGLLARPVALPGGAEAPRAARAEARELELRRGASGAARHDLAHVLVGVAALRLLGEPRGLREERKADRVHQRGLAGARRAGDEEQR